MAEIFKFTVLVLKHISFGTEKVLTVSTLCFVNKDKCYNHVHYVSSHKGNRIMLDTHWYPLNISDCSRIIISDCSK